MARVPKNMQDPPQFSRREDVHASRTAVMSDGTEIKLYLEIKTIEANPISRVNIIGRGVGYPKAGERFKVYFRFESIDHAMHAFEQLCQRRACLATYADKLDVPCYAVCL